MSNSFINIVLEKLVSEGSCKSLIRRGHYNIFFLYAKCYVQIFHIVLCGFQYRPLEDNAAETSVVYLPHCTISRARGLNLNTLYHDTFVCVYVFVYIYIIKYYIYNIL